MDYKDALKGLREAKAIPYAGAKVEDEAPSQAAGGRYIAVKVDVGQKGVFHRGCEVDINGRLVNAITPCVATCNLYYKGQKIAADEQVGFRHPVVMKMCVDLKDKITELISVLHHASPAAGNRMDGYIADLRSDLSSMILGDRSVIQKYCETEDERRKSLENMWYVPITTADLLSTVNCLDTTVSSIVCDRL